MIHPTICRDHVMMSYVYIQITTTVFQKCRVSYPEKKNFDRQYLAMCIITIVTAASIYIYITMSCTFIVPVVARIIVIARYFNNITYTYEGTSCMFLCL